MSTTPSAALLAKDLWDIAGIDKVWDRKPEAERKEFEQGWARLNAAQRDRVTTLARLGAQRCHQGLPGAVMNGGGDEMVKLTDQALSKMLRSRSDQECRNSYIEGFREISTYGADHRLTVSKMHVAGVLIAAYTAMCIGLSGTLAGQLLPHVGLHTVWLTGASSAWMKSTVVHHLAGKDILLTGNMVKGKAFGALKDRFMRHAESEGARAAVDIAFSLAAIASDVAVDKGIEDVRDAVVHASHAAEVTHFEQAVGQRENQSSDPVSGIDKVVSPEAMSVAKASLTAVVDHDPDEALLSQSFWHHVRGPLFAFAEQYRRLADDPAASEIQDAALEIMRVRKERRPQWSGRALGEVLRDRLADRQDMSVADVFNTLHLADTKYTEYRHANAVVRIAMLTQAPTPRPLRIAAMASRDELKKELASDYLLNATQETYVGAVDMVRSGARKVEAMGHSIANFFSREADDARARVQAMPADKESGLSAWSPQA